MVVTGDYYHDDLGVTHTAPLDYAKGALGESPRAKAHSLDNSYIRTVKGKALIAISKARSAPTQTSTIHPSHPLTVYDNEKDGDRQSNDVVDVETARTGAGVGIYGFWEQMLQVNYCNNPQ